LNAALRWYLASSASVVFAGGIGMVLFPWLIAVALHESAQRVGIAQMAGSLPALFLILFGGVVADRFDQRRILVAMHIVNVVQALVLVWLLAAGALSYAVLVAYALIGGIVGAFAQPARDALLSRVAGDRIQRAVTLMMGLQFSAQLVGIGLGSLAERAGAVPLVLTQAAVIGAGTFAVLALRVPPLDRQRGERALDAVRDGVKLVFASPRMRPVMLLNVAMGLFFAGTFAVLIPLLVRDVYRGGAGEIGSAYMLNMLGTVAATVALLARGGVARPGRALLVSLGVGALLFLPVVFGIPLRAFYALIGVWGIGGGIVMSLGRTIIQEAAPASHRARVLSVYSLGMMGGMPLGSLMMGYVIDAFGPLNAAWVPVLGMGAAVAWTAAKSDLWVLVPHAEPARV